MLDPDGRQIFLPERGIVILAYMRASQRSEVSREILAGMLWPDVDRSIAFKNLRSTLLRLRTAGQLSEVPLAADGKMIRLQSDALRSDLDCFLPGDDKLSRLRLIVETMKEEFLANARNVNGPLKRWIEGQRRSYGELLRAAVIDASPIASERADIRAVKIACVQILQRSPNDMDIRNILDRAKIIETGDAPDRLFAVPHSLQTTPDTAISVTPTPSQAERPLLPRVALLPPDTAEDSRVNGSVANALIEDVTIGLCSLRTVSVVAPFTSERIREADDKAAVLEKHGVIYALDTKRSGEGLFTQLIFLPTDEIIWAERFPLTAEGLTTQRSEISRTITQTIARQVEESATAQLDFEARPQMYLNYLQGMQHLSELSLPGIRRARKKFRETLRQYPDFAPALAGMARTLTTEWLLTARGDEELLAAAEQKAKAAVHHNAGLAAGHRELGVVQLYLQKLDESLEALSIAETISPHYADALYSHADSLVHAAKPKDGLNKIEKAIELNPLCPDLYFWTAAGASYFLGEFEDAVAYVGKMQDGRPADRLLAASWGMLGEKSKARSCRQRVLRDNPSFNLERWLEVVPNRENWQRELYREGLIKAGF
ncbi:adenylate cyclase [Rhizobium herbae]|uniref:DNA-binding SARP family transcriptional activator/tetratricopeptide (TPR) repeat protein n=1 Tax=Rhizobium herbae TaxID=508661 RepID=A0ABS4EQ37_9HYPH|nr:adenylate cyclase [Rhizobium herbae]MBP1860043.1 DNA-binding SARP family transcriptional activator/tetratricopeptide (TPR) repeat protein [Rhizobium herbae]